MRGARAPAVHLSGREAGRGPDNEPLVCDARAVARLHETVIEQAAAEVTRQDSAGGPLRRRDPGLGTAPGTAGGGGRAGTRRRAGQ